MISKPISINHIYVSRSEKVSENSIGYLEISWGIFLISFLLVEMEGAKKALKESIYQIYIF